MALQPLAWLRIQENYSIALAEKHGLGTMTGRLWSGKGDEWEWTFQHGSILLNRSQEDNVLSIVLAPRVDTRPAKLDAVATTGGKACVGTR